MITADQIPPEVVEAAARALCEDARLFWPDLTKAEHDIMRGEAHAAIAAALNAWPGAQESGMTYGKISTHIYILPLPQEPEA